MDQEPVDHECVEAVARAWGATLAALTAEAVEVEVRLLRGLLGVIKIIGLRESAGRETRERVRSAIKASGYRFPERSLLINLAPAELEKIGPGLDLAIACAILAVTGQIPQAAIGERIFWGELALDGRLRANRGAIPVALLARKKNARALVLPAPVATETGLVGSLATFPAGNLRQTVEILRGQRPAPPLAMPSAAAESANGANPWDMIVGQANAKHAVVTAAAGGHHLLLIGPPGAGKSMLAKSLVHLLPDLTEEQALAVSCIHSAAGLPARVTTRRPPFRSPHCSITSAGIAGGGSVPRPGEMTLAHHGLLFLDELPHFRREVHDLLRTPLEEGAISLARAGRVVEMPAAFQLIAAMNPCPCGQSGDAEAACSCSPAEVLRYRNRISGPVLDRLDLTIRVPFVPAELRRASPGTVTAVAARGQVKRARTLQRQRNEGRLNSELNPEALQEVTPLAGDAREWLAARIDRLRLSLRAHHRLLRVARTIADLDTSEPVQLQHLIRAFTYREPAAPD